MKCIKCKQPLPDGVAFCSRCGTSVEATKKQLDKRKFRFIVLIVIVLVVLAILSCTVVISGNIHNLKMGQSIAAANVSAGGDVATCGDKVYLISDNSVYLTTPTYSSRNRLFGISGTIQCICADENAVYYISKEYVNKEYLWQLNAYHFDKEEKEKLTDLSGECSQLAVWNGRLLFLQDNSLKAFELAAAELNTIAGDNILAYTYSDNGLYYIRNTLPHTLAHKAAIDADETLVTSLPYAMLGMAIPDQMYLCDQTLYARYTHYTSGHLYHSVGFALDLSSEKGEYTEMEGAVAQYPTNDGIYYLLKVDSNSTSETDAYVDYYYDYAAEKYINNWPSLNLNKYDSDVRDGVEAQLWLSCHNKGRVYYSKHGDSSCSIVRTDSRYYSNIYRTSAGFLLWEGQTGSWDFFSP